MKFTYSCLHEDRSILEKTVWKRCKSEKFKMVLKMLEQDQQRQQRSWLKPLALQTGLLKRMGHYRYSRHWIYHKQELTLQNFSSFRFNGNWNKKLLWKLKEGNILEFYFVSCSHIRDKYSNLFSWNSQVTKVIDKPGLLGKVPAEIFNETQILKIDIY